MSLDTSAPRSTPRLLYPVLPATPTAGDLHRLFTPSLKERTWASTVTRTPASQVALLVQLRTFQAVGRFLGAEEIPSSAIEHVAGRLGVEGQNRLSYPRATRYRHQAAILGYLGVTAWGTKGRALAESTMRKTAEARTDPADLINAAVDALVRHRFELPALIALRRLAGTVHSEVNAAQWQVVGAAITEKQRAALEALLVVSPDTQESPFAALCRAPAPC